jgi:hypothetical protein
MGLPPIEVVSFSEERPRDAFGSFVRHAPSTPWRHPLIAQAADFAAGMRRNYQITFGISKGFDPRTDSRVEHRIDHRACEVLEGLRHDHALPLALGPLTLSGDPDKVSYDAFEREYRVAARLHLPWSWPELPLWLAVGELSTSKSALRLRLRSRRRLRYPTRYFNAAHAVLGGLESRLGFVSR